jgi:hypothetical protein
VSLQALILRLLDAGATLPLGLQRALLREAAPGKLKLVTPHAVALAGQRELDPDLRAALLSDRRSAVRRVVLQREDLSADELTGLPRLKAEENLKLGDALARQLLELRDVKDGLRVSAMLSLCPARHGSAGSARGAPAEEHLEPIRRALRLGNSAALAFDSVGDGWLAAEALAAGVVLQTTAACQRVLEGLVEQRYPAERSQAIAEVLAEAPALTPDQAAALLAWGDAQQETEAFLRESLQVKLQRFSGIVAEVNALTPVHARAVGLALTDDDPQEMLRLARSRALARDVLAYNPHLTIEAAIALATSRSTVPLRVYAARFEHDPEALARLVVHTGERLLQRYPLDLELGAQALLDLALAEQGDFAGVLHGLLTLGHSGEALVAGAPWQAVVALDRHVVPLIAQPLAELLSEGLGDDAGAWETFAALQSEYGGGVAELIGTCKALSPGS